MISKMLAPVDRFLNSITMYRLVLYALTAMSVVAIVLGFAGYLPYSGFALLSSLFLLLAVCYIANELFSRLFGIPVNIESVYITAYILFFMLFPSMEITDAILLAIAGVIAMASKFFIAPHGRHIFNPAAFAAVILGLAGMGQVFWWVGSAVMLPAVAILGFLVVRKIRRASLFFAFFLSAAAAMILLELMLGRTFQSGLQMVMQNVLSWPVIFFGTIMLTEPFTMPPTRNLRIAFGIFVGVIFAIPFHLGPIYASPELALLVGNAFAYLVSYKRRIFLTLHQKKQLAKDTYEFSFSSPQKVHFEPGQYLEWMLPHEKADTRGVRRYFTIASSPTEADLKLGIKFNTPSSTFKQSLGGLKEGAQLTAGQLMGDFMLPDDISQKLVFIAGGIGVTPFRSMVKYLLDTEDKRDVTLFYTVKSPDEIAYKELFDEATRKHEMRAVYVVTDQKNVPADWNGRVGFCDAKMFEEEIPDYKERLFYLSGPNAMVESYKKLLLGMGVSRSKIKTDYFPGF